MMSESSENKCPSGEKETKAEDKNEIRFWSEDPNVLLRFPYILEFFPTDQMTYAQKMNSISRLILVLAVVGFLFARNVRLLVVAVAVLLGIYLIYASHRESKRKKKRVVFSEEFDPSIPGELIQNVYDELNKSVPTKADVFDAPMPHNPMSNVLMSDYDYNPHKKPAPPAFNQNVGATILSQAKQMVVDANPGQPDIADKLFRNLGDELIFEQSMRPFVSNPSTTIPNDQQAFADFCYGSMISSKEGNMFSLARNLARHQT